MDMKELKNRVYSIQEELDTYNNMLERDNILCDYFSECQDWLVNFLKKHRFYTLDFSPLDYGYVFNNNKLFNGDLYHYEYGNSYYKELIDGSVIKVDVCFNLKYGEKRYGLEHPIGFKSIIINFIKG